ncbi:putative mucin/carbohydrate-binding domain-containing protein [Pseudomonas sp. S2_D06]
MHNQEVLSVIHQFYSLERPVWMMNSGLDKGVNHDRKTLNIVISAGATIRFRQKTPMSNPSASLNLLNDDSKNEKHAEITAQWQSLVASVPSVPFVTTRYTDKPGELTEVEIEVSGGWKFLPVYTEAIPDSSFLSLWDQSEAEFALFSSVYMNILIPAKDKDAVKALSQNVGLQHLVNYYNGLFEYYNHLEGLSFTPDTPENKNIPNRFFMKADKSASPFAYYSGGWTAVAADSVADFSLDTKPTNWGALHEIGHGYQGAFMSNSSLVMGEVWNNVFAASYQHKFMGEDVYRDGWLYDGGEQNLYSRAMTEFDSERPLDIYMALFFLMLVFHRAGEQCLVQFHKRYRKLCNSVGFSLADNPMMDHLSRTAIDVADSDVSAFMEHANIELSQRQIDENSYSGATPVYPLYALVPASMIEPLQQLLAVRSPLHLVSAAQLAAVTDLTGSVTLKFDSDVFGEVVGQMLVLKSGSGKSRCVKIDQLSVSVLDLPVGVYALQLPFAANGEYQPTSRYVIVKQGSTSYDCIYFRKHASSLADQKIMLGGFYGDFCTISVAVSLGKLMVDVILEVPHEYAGAKLYGQVTVRNMQGLVVFDRQMMGDKTELFSQEIPIEPGFSIEIFHEEPSRMKSTGSDASKVIDDAKKTNHLRVTEQGLVNVELTTNAGANLQAEMEKKSTLFEQSPHLVLREASPLKKDFELAINSFSGPVRDELLMRYKKIEFVRPPVSDGVGGARITWLLKGYYDQVVGYVKFDFDDNVVRFEFFKVVPHMYVASVYLAVALKSADGGVRYLRELRGDVLAEAESVVLPLNIDDTVSVMHKEPSRSVMEADANGRWINTGLVQHVTNRGLRRLELASYWPAATTDSEPGGA